MINKFFSNKLSLCLVLMCALFIVISRPVIVAADVSVRQMDHETVKADKVWTIKFNKAINQDNLSKNVFVYKPGGGTAAVSISYDSINNTIKIAPPASGYVSGQTYCLQISKDIMDLNSNPMVSPVIKNFTIEVPNSGDRTSSVNNQFDYVKYDKTLGQIVDIQCKTLSVNVLPNYLLNASDMDISAYVNPKNFENYDYAVYQFLTLNYVEGITAEQLNVYLEGNGVLEGQGEAFIAAAKINNINVAYLTAHTILETGHGTSKLAAGILVNQVDGVTVPSKMTYNMFGIKATDDNPSKNGSEYAFKKGWFTVGSAIMGGAEYISTQYINNDVREQNTLYKMRWNPSNTVNTATHQYATDIGWSYKISCITKQIQDQDINAKLTFEIPQYK